MNLLQHFFLFLVYEIKLGTVDLKDADTEWVLRPYQRTARKRDHL
jgi:U3 small nucleolar ribonucleoprotein protein IMP4